jgi:hypothetical protein
MAITVKDINGADHNVSSKGLGGTALGLAIGALGVEALNGGLLTNGSSSSSSAPVGQPVTQQEFFNEVLEDRDRQYANYIALHDEICDLKAQVAVNSTANTYQNMINDKQFACVDSKFDYTNLLTDYKISSATCNAIRGDLTLPLSRLSNGFQATDNFLATYSTVPAPVAAPAPVSYLNSGYNGYGVTGYSNSGCGCCSNGSWYY